MPFNFSRPRSFVRRVLHGRGETRVLFGEKSDWHAMIDEALGGSAIRFEFGNLVACDPTHFDLVVPLKIDDYHALRSRRQDVRGRALFPEPEAVAICDDKGLFNTRLADSGLGKLVPTVLQRVPPKYPFILKRRRDEYGVHSHIVASHDDLDHFGALVANTDYFMQDYVEGSTEYTTHFLIKNSEIEYFVNVIFDMQAQRYVKGANFKARSTTLNHEPNFAERLLPVLRAVGFADGTCCINFKITNGQIKIFEMNPRFGGTLINDLRSYLSAYRDAVSTTG